MRIIHEIPGINDDTSREAIEKLADEWLNGTPEECFYVPDEPQYRGKSYEEILEIRKKEREIES